MVEFTPPVQLLPQTLYQDQMATYIPMISHLFLVRHGWLNLHFLMVNLPWYLYDTYVYIYMIHIYVYHIYIYIWYILSMIIPFCPLRYPTFTLWTPSPLVPLVRLPSRYGLLHEDGPGAVHEEKDVAIAEEIHGALQGAMRQEQQASELSPRKKNGEINGEFWGKYHEISDVEFGHVYVICYMLYVIC